MNTKQSKPSPPLFRSHFDSDHAVVLLSQSLYSTILPKIHFYDIIVVCIGTDRSTGDSLGPIVGSKLTKLAPTHLHIYGTLDDPIHAVNLQDKLEFIKQKHTQPFIIAIDACLGELKNVGMLTLAEGALKPGAGVNKKLPDVGHVHITGIVNVGGFMEYFVLQNTRLSLVMKMADAISSAIFYTSLSMKKKKGSNAREPLPF